MAIAKYSGLKLGPGFSTDGYKSGECEFFCEQSAPSPSDGKDGDAWFQVPAAGYPVGGSDVDLFLKASGGWVSLRNKEIQFTLNDGQSPAAVALAIPASIFAYANVEYTVRRGLGHGRKRQGVLRILNDGASSVQYSHDFDEIGSDVNIPFTVSISGGFVNLEYTSATEGNTITFAYKLTGWT